MVSLKYKFNLYIQIKETRKQRCLTGNLMKVVKL